MILALDLYDDGRHILFLYSSASPDIGWAAEPHISCCAAKHKCADIFATNFPHFKEKGKKWLYDDDDGDDDDDDDDDFQPAVVSKFDSTARAKKPPTEMNF